MNESLKYIINHVFLPPKLPQKDDRDDAKDEALAKQLLVSLQSLQQCIPEQTRSEWRPCIQMLDSMLKLRDDSGGLVAEEMIGSLQKMNDKDILLLHVRSENAGLIIRRSPQHYSFESFELSPTTEAVTSTIGRLRRYFPGPAIQVNQDRIADSSFLEPLVELLVKLDAETPQEALPTTKKARSTVPEARDATHPKFITEMLTGILRAVGQPHDVARIHKHTRDEILLKKAYKPWRRSALWLLLRVALQTTLMRKDDKVPHLRYKLSMTFFMVEILRRALATSLPSDILFTMTAKITRRALKLGFEAQTVGLQNMHTTIQAVQQELRCRWNLIQRDPDPFRTQQVWLQSNLSLVDDTELSIPTLRPYLKRVLTRSALPSNPRSFTSDSCSRIQQSSSSLPDLSLLPGDQRKISLFLTDLEFWVERFLDDWLRMNREREDASTALAKLIDTYITVASSAYCNMPEDISLMLLTTIELWIGLDKCALHHYPLLRDYCPEFPSSLFEPLLLPRKPQMERLARVEWYLSSRRKEAVSGYPSIFGPVDRPNSFAVRYFDQPSLNHQQLRDSIEAKATTERSQKISELAQKNRQYNELMRKIYDIECEYVNRRRKGRQVSEHSSSCKKCSLRSRAGAMRIDVHEWPLPLSDLAVKAVVFELDVPTIVSKWRDTTYSLLVDIFSSDSRVSGSSRDDRKQREAYYLHDYSGLESFKKSSAGRLQLASETKSFIMSHYRNKEVSKAKENNICVNNGLSYCIYDSEQSNRTQELLGRCDVREKCTLKLPSGPYTCLQYAVNNTTHTSNKVMASQYKCPATLTHNEFYVFGTLRSGHRLQWRNVARELVARTLSFSRPETHILLMQAIWQAGPSDKQTPLRESHVDLKEPEFGRSLLSMLNVALGTVEGNWQGATALRTFVAMVARLLSTSNCKRIREDCYRFLRRARTISLHWTRVLGQTVQEEQNENKLKASTIRMLEMALTCYSTFDVDLHDLPALITSDNDIAIVTECAIIVHDRCPAMIDDVPVLTRPILRRYWRLSSALEPILRERLSECSNGLNSTIKRLWAGYVPGSSWAALETPNERWLMSETSSEDGASSMLVHYNLLDGNLLINGSPLTRLPHSYESHPTFRRLFGKKIFDVVPATMTGMAFEARNMLYDHQLYFSMHESELIVRTKKGGRTYELLPVHALSGDFPQALVENYAHWLDIDTGVVEWRPLIDPWKTTTLNWQMRQGNREEELLLSGPLRMIDIHTPTANAVSAMFSPLENASHIHITYNLETEALNIHLPRLKLDFIWREGASRPASKQFRNMIIDENQSFGALTGLVNKLVLRGVTDSSRSVLVPHGKVVFEENGSHVSVRIDLSEPHMSYHLYQIDSKIGRLVDNGSLKNDLTGQTGTEEALSTLASPSIRSFLKLTQEEVSLLKLLAQLTPHRHYYPHNLRVMQEVEWNALPPLSQHPSFQSLVKSIFDQARESNLFLDECIELPQAEICGEQDLLRRAEIRDSSYRVHGFGAELHTANHDVTYRARDCVPDSPREHEVCHIAKLVDSWSRNLKVCTNLLQEFESWSMPLKAITPEGSFLLGYDTKWLDDPQDYLHEYWRTLQSTLSQSVVNAEKYRIMMFLSTLAYSGHWKQELIHTLLSFATVPELSARQLTNSTSLDLSHGYEPDAETLRRMTMNRIRPFDECPEHELSQSSEETRVEADQRRWDRYEIASEQCVGHFVDALLRQWPNVNIRSPTGSNFKTYLPVNLATEEARNWFRTWNRNAKFKKEISIVQSILDRLQAGSYAPPTYSFLEPDYIYVRKKHFVELADILVNGAPRLPAPPSQNFQGWISRVNQGDKKHDQLRSLLVRLSSKSLNLHELQYVRDLWNSFHALRKDSVERRFCGSTEDLKRPLEEYFTQCQNHVNQVYHMICRAFRGNTTTTSQLAYEAGMWPRISTASLLQLIARVRENSLPKYWRAALVEYGVAVADLQRAERLLMCLENVTELLSELDNMGDRAWSPTLYPDWLLLEIENNITIRRVQARIAQEMISPASGLNSILQLNMGEGKTSVIVPMVAAALANQEKLARIVVLKPLSTQMFHVLLSKLGGMLSRRIFHMPISRSLRLNVEQARQIRSMCEECMRNGGVLLVQPEHLLSFELMGVERLLANETDLGNALIETQRWMNDNSRDVLDESDEILSVRFELIYTIGTQRGIEFSPDRWTIIEQVLGLVRHFAPEILHHFPHGLELHTARPGRFHRVRTLNAAATRKLLELVAREICEVGLQGLPVSSFPQNVRAILFTYLTNIHVSRKETELLQNHIDTVDSMKQGLLLLRGLIAGGVLAFALQQKRWRVDNGLDLSRTMLAVPYRAKDIPATRAEFSHPDATIVLTCLSYYYGGLSDTQLYDAFEKLLLSDNAQEEYEGWIEGASELPMEFRQLTGINLSDSTQCSQKVFPLLRFAKGAIDFYVSRIVFPKDMKEFPHKLSSSGWDIARQKAHPTTGFSGTNDSRYVLPLSIEQCDLQPQLHTNAAVLDCLLRPENTFLHAVHKAGTENLDAESLLQTVIQSDPPVRVILDSGAQVLEWKNEEVAENWLLRVPEAQAAIFFDDANELSVLNRDGMTELLMTSPFAKQMDQCLVYLDEAHTRGTDLKLPTRYRAAVTLGPNLTKDRLVQACMRMRKLGKGQSVMFCGPPEVERKILDCCGKAPEDGIEIADVLQWSIRETCANSKRCIPLWATQGMRYLRRSVVWSGSSNDRGSGALLKSAKSLLEVEAQSLQDRYGFTEQRPEEQVLLHNMEDDSLSGREAQVQDIRAKCQEFELGSFNSATLQEEQERELSPENEQERQVERPPALEPHNHIVHKHVRKFICEGILRRDSDAFQPAFELFNNTSARACLGSSGFPRHLLVTKDFAQTVRAAPDQHLDSFLRPVHWVASKLNGDAVDYVVLSPFEAHMLLPSIRSQRLVTLHVYSPRVNVSVQTMEDLSFCAIPATSQHQASPSLIRQLNLFAGQLYLKDYAEYISVCRFLGLYFRPPSDDHVRVAADGFVDPRHRKEFDVVMERECPFTTSPVGFLRMVLAFRRKGQGFERTHLGRMLRGELLGEEHFGQQKELVYR